jgi:hypothetical protein
LKEIGTDEREWEKQYGGRLPVSFFDHMKKFPSYFPSSQVVGVVGSQRLIEFFFGKIYN